MKKILFLVLFLTGFTTATFAQQVPDELRLALLAHNLDSPVFPAQQEKPPPTSPPATRDNDPTKINLVTGQGDVSEANYQPMTGKQRVQLWLNGSFTTPGAYLGSIGTSLLDQAGGTPKEWGGGMKGYGRRLLSRVGTNTVQGAIQSSTAAVLGLDPRYIRSSSKNVSHRVEHALFFGIVTYNNEGKTRVNLANIASFYGSALVTTTWQPKSNAALSNGFKDGTRQVMFSGLSNVFQEFWPDMIKVLKRK